MKTENRTIAIIAHQLPLCPPLPRIIGPVEFDEFCALWERLDAMLTAGVERQFVLRSLECHLPTRKRRMTLAEQVLYQTESRQALRCTLARLLLNESLRDFSCHLAESPLLQRFCLRGDLEAVYVPGHSQLQRYATWLPDADMRAVVIYLTGQARAASAPTTLGVAHALDFATVWVDTTCAETNIHYPVDWVLLRDATRTLIQAIIVLREHALKHRMPEPTTFLRDVNQLCIKMTHAGKGEKGKQQRKVILREMKELVQTVQGHAERYSALVDALPAPQGWAIASRRRMQDVLEQLPAVLHQAHERIIGERPVATASKVLSLYEPATAVLSRGKSGAQVEYGYSLFLAEQQDGLIVDWALPQTPQPDGDLLCAGITRWQTAYGAETIRAVVTDRGFDGPVTRAALAEAGIANGMCPRSPRQLVARLADPVFREQQRRRAQTEGRIAIVKQTFLGGRLHTKGYAHQSTEMAWVVLAHNLWVLARLPVASKLKLAA